MTERPCVNSPVCQRNMTGSKETQWAMDRLKIRNRQRALVHAIFSDIPRSETPVRAFAKLVSETRDNGLGRVRSPRNAYRNRDRRRIVSVRCDRTQSGARAGGTVVAGVCEADKKTRPSAFGLTHSHWPRPDRRGVGRCLPLRQLPPKATFIGLGAETVAPNPKPTRPFAIRSSQGRRPSTCASPERRRRRSCAPSSCSRLSRKA